MVTSTGSDVTSATSPPASRLTLQDLVAPHVDSFSWFVEQGLHLGVEDLPALDVVIPDQPRLRVWIEKVALGTPDKADDSLDTRLTPNECRERGISYTAGLTATVCRSVDGRLLNKQHKKLGALPLMVKSAHCVLQHLTPAQLVKRREEATELGGYFIVNGIEKVVRLIIVPRRHYVIAMKRNSFVNRGPRYTPYATSIRCVKPDMTSRTVSLHYLKDGAVNLRFSMEKAEYFVPAMLVLRALIPTTDRQIYEQTSAGASDDTFLNDRLEMLLRGSHSYNVWTQQHALSYIGQRFRIAMDVPSDVADADVGQRLLDQCIFIHLSSGTDKFNLLCFMLRKLYALVAGSIDEDNPDSPMVQEVLLPGHLYSMIVKEKLGEWLQGLRNLILRDLRVDPTRVNFADDLYFKRVIDRNFDLGRKLDYFLATGNLISPSGLDLMQTSGYAVVGEKLNYYRFLSHFRAVHRGQFFTTMKTTSVRKLLPECWGFLCPVHTPDGTPCGLLNHLASWCQLQTETPDTSELPQLLCAVGMTPISAQSVLHAPSQLPVLLDGRVVGSVDRATAGIFCARLRVLKVSEEPGVPSRLEVGHVPALPDGHVGGLLPGVFLFSQAARFTRPVRHLPTGQVEWIGSFEQVYMDIACLGEDLRAGVTTHQELAPTNMLSMLASLTPFSDFNQSPRNMYQCQMAKQTMGTPFHSIPHRTDNKAYRIQTPQSPLVQNQLYSDLALDEYPTGANAVVAVISYTGYDMEDAMIINKAAYERGFGHGTVYKSLAVDLDRFKQQGEVMRFSNEDLGDDGPSIESLDDDGLPRVGAVLRQGDPVYRLVNMTTRQCRVVKHKDVETAHVEQVRLLGGAGPLTRISITLRYNRNPIIGDKFSSRHGQKGVLSQLWPQENMPFSESGMSPDVIINPHAFPSRMTIGMLVESMAGKSAALHGIPHQDSTPFRFSEKHRAIDFFGEQLTKAGYHYYGNEVMYSGMYGTEFKADIFLGVVYYQRLRHMVSDKFQVRSTGPVDRMTHQPVKGRKRGGGIRFGEMERDSLLAHGTAFLLHDRLFHCSDPNRSYVCRLCGSILAPVVSASGAGVQKRVSCRYCKTDSGIEVVAIPYVFRYLVTELAAMNIRVSLAVQ